jgi:ABC-type glycerol-3-phosphate transport system substrate-binding protein
MNMNKFKYQAIVNHIEEDIFPNLLPGALLPGEKELCRRYNVSGITIKKALSLLTLKRQIKRIPGKGTIFYNEHQPQISRVSAKPPRTILKVLTLGGWDSADLLEKLCRAFSAQYPETEFEFHRSSPLHFEEYSLEGYDLIHGNTWMIREYLTSPEYKKYILPLNELPDFFINESIYFEEAMKWCRVNGKLSCLPLGVSPVIAMFNMDYPVLKKMQLPLCSTFEEFRRLLYRLQYERKGESTHYPFLLEMQENRWPCLIKMLGGQLFDPVSNQCTLSLPQTVNALNAAKQMIHDKIVPSPQFGSDFSSSGLFATGKIACMWGTFRYVRENVSKKANFKYQMLPQPETNCSHLLIEGLMVNRNCRNPDMTGKLFNFLQTSAAQLEICRHADVFSAQRELARLYLESLAFQEPSVINIFEQVKYAEPAVWVPRSIEWKTLNRILPKIWMGVDSIENVCREITETINKNDNK